MKRIAGYICALILVISLVGCAETTPSQESNVNTAVSSDSSTTPGIASKSTSAPAPTPPPISTPTPRAFDVDDVVMQSTPKSTCFSEVGYDSGWEVLVVQFRDGGSVYTYSAFPEDQWKEFMAAGSLGRWYNAHIKGQYAYERIS